MFRNYILTAWRNLRKHKVFSLINILGLAFGLTCCLLIAMWIGDELSYDRFHRNAGQTYRLTVDMAWSGNTLSTEGMPVPLGPALQQNYPSIASVVRISAPQRTLMKHGEKALFAESVYYVDSTFLRVFTFPVLYGDPQTALEDPNALVLTEALAGRLFGSAGEAVGRVVQVEAGTPRTVTAVIGNVPGNSHLQFDALSPLPAYETYAEESANWGNFNYATYLLMREGTDVAALEAKMGDFYRRIVSPAIGTDGEAKMDFALHFQPLTEVHLGSTNLRGHEKGATMAYVYAFSGIAVFMLLIACINYMNLATARSLKRAKEVGIRKVVGSSRGQLVGQYLAESLLVALLALVISLTLVQLAMPLFNHITAKRLSVLDFLDGSALAGLAAVALFTGLVSGSYPAFVLSGYKPVEVLKGGSRAAPRGLWVRRSLVVFQFAVSALMIVGTLVVYQQLQYMKNNHPGYSREQVLTVKLPGEDMAGKAALFKDRLLSHAQVNGVSFAGSPIGERRISSDQFLFSAKGQTQRVQSENMEVDYDYLPVLNIRLKAGRNFNRANTTDREAVLINETLARRLGVAAPVGMEIKMYDKTYRIIGIIRDFHLNSLHNNIEPLLLRLTPESGGHVYVKAATKDAGAARAIIEREYARLGSGYPLELGFLDQVFARQYAEDERKSGLFLAFASANIFIACLGLFGLAAFSMEQRRKEIGIRKVLGATVPNLVSRLSGDFLVLVLAANLAAWPLAWFGLQAWLRTFPYRISMTPWVFLATGALTLGITLLTVGFQTLRAARTNPVSSLRSE